MVSRQRETVMTSKWEGRTIRVEGYGKLEGASEGVQIGTIKGGTVQLTFTDGTDGSKWEVPFRLADGAAAGSSPMTGYRIPEETLAELKGTGSGKVNPESERPEQASTPAEPGKAPVVKRRRLAAPASAGKEGNDMAGTATAEPAAPVRKKKTPAVEAPPAVETNGNGAAPAARKRTVPATTPAETAAPVTRKKAAPATTGAEPAAETEPARLSPMEEAAEQTARNRKRRADLGETGFEIKVSPLMYRQILFNEVEPYPNGRRVPGFKEFKAAFMAASERSYVYVIVTQEAAEYLVNKVFVDGFERNWKGSLTGGFKRGAKRNAEELASRFGLTIPAVIENHVSGAKDVLDEPEEAPAATTRKRKPAEAPAPAAVAAPSAPVRRRPVAAAPVTAAPAGKNGTAKKKTS
jgi:hypothetical protein